MKAYLLEICHMLPLPISKYIILFFVDKHFEKREKTTQKRKRDKKKPLYFSISQE
jgi:hypothetical protein